MGEDLVLTLFAFLPCVSAWLLVLVYRRRRRANARAGWPLVLFGNFLLLFLLVSLLALAGEVYFRFAYDSTDSLMFTKVSQRWFERHFHLNGAKIRDDINYDLTLPRGKRRVSFVGDSFTAAHGVKNIEDRFVNRLRRAHPEWEVHMLARLGFDTGDELGFLRACLDKGYKLDEVVLVYCLNDISDMMPERREAIRRVYADVAAAGWLRRNSFLVNMLYHRLKVRRDPFMRGYYDLVREAYRDGPLWDEQRRRLESFRNLVQTNGGHLAVVTFPFLHALGPVYDYEFVHERLDRLWRELNVPHLDLLPAYRPFTRTQLTVNQFDAHPNEYAHALATPLIEKLVREELARSEPPATPAPAQPESPPKQ